MNDYPMNTGHDLNAWRKRMRLTLKEAALANGRSCIQVHGGMGFTWEVPAHLAYKRARVLATQFGTGDELAAALADSLADPPAPASRPPAGGLG